MACCFVLARGLEGPREPATSGVGAAESSVNLPRTALPPARNTCSDEILLLGHAWVPAYALRSEVTR